MSFEQGRLIKRDFSVTREQGFGMMRLFQGFAFHAKSDKKALAGEWGETPWSKQGLGKM